MKMTVRLEAGSPRLLSEVAYERIKESIRTAELEPGQPLSEKKLSTLLGISRTPIRHAIQQLAREGLVQIIPGRAVTVASLSVQEVMNAIRIRAILEPGAANTLSQGGGLKYSDLSLSRENDDQVLSTGVDDKIILKD